MFDPFNIKNILGMYDNCDTELRGTYITDYMNLSDIGIDIFFQKFTKEVKILEVNPGSDLMSGDWMENTYGLTKIYKREFNLNKILNKNEFN